MNCALQEVGYFCSMKRAVVLFSGGQDSTTCLYWALTQFDEVQAIGFDYGQRHREELDQAAQIAKLANVKYTILSLRGLLSGSSLTDHELAVDEPHAQAPELPSTFTPGRNLLFLSAAGSYAYTQESYDLVIGCCQTDFSGYPDCRQIFLESTKTTLGLAMDCDFRIHAPLMYLTKAETWRLAAELSSDGVDVLEIVRTLTLTDYNGSREENEWGMGRLDNAASRLRAKGYFEEKEQGWLT